MHRSRPFRPLSTLVLAIGLVLGMVAAGCGADDDGAADEAEAGGGTDAATSTTATIAASTSSPRTVPTSTTGSPSEPAELARWAGRYVWDEFVEGDPGSDQFVVHQLVLLDAGPTVDTGADPGLAGRLTHHEPR